MKKAIALVCSLILLLFCVPFERASADSVTLAQLGAAFYGMANDFGLSFIFAGSSASDAQSLSTSIVSKYVNEHGGDLPSLIGSSVIKSVAGKLIVPAQIYNLIRGIISDYVTDKGISTTEKAIVGGFLHNSPVYTVGYTGGSSTTWIIDQIGENSGDATISANITGNNLSLQAFYGGNSISGRYDYTLTNNTSGNTREEEVFLRAAFGKTSSSSTIYIYFATVLNVYNISTGELDYSLYMLTQGYSVDGVSSGSVNAVLDQNYNIGDELSLGKAWKGDFGEASDTNLDQLIGDIYSQTSNNDINVDSEIIDEQPVPTPRPTTPPATDVLGGINDLIGQQDQVLEGIDTITGEVSQTAEAAQEAAEAAQEAAEALQEGLDVVSAQDASNYKFDLSTLFPFCIPFDIVRMLQAFDGIAEAPHVQIPFVIQSMNFRYLIDLDFSSFSPVAAVLRQVELIAFGIALAYATSKVIRW